MRTRFLPLAALLLLGGCAKTAPEPPPTVPPPPPCPITSSSDWVAHVEPASGANARPNLTVTGRVTVPGSDWRPRWGEVRVLESYPAQVQLQLDADLPPAGISTNPVIKEVSGSWPTEAPVHSVTISCRGTTLTRIAPVPTAP